MFIISSIYSTVVARNLKIDTFTSLLAWQALLSILNASMSAHENTFAKRKRQIEKNDMQKREDLFLYYFCTSFCLASSSGANSTSK
jgi:hypothetical protein